MSGIFVNVGSLSRYGGQISSLSRALVAVFQNVFADAQVAFALRVPATSTYAGPLLRVRRSSDNAEQDFYASAVLDIYGNRWLDTAALLAFVGAGNGFVRTWYDQSGNARHAVQATAANQPRVVNAGAVEMLNGNPAIRGIAASRLLVLGYANVTVGSANAVFRMNTNDGSIYRSPFSARVSNSSITANTTTPAIQVSGATGADALTGNGSNVAAFIDGSAVSSLSNFNNYAVGVAAATGVAHVHTQTMTPGAGTLNMLLLADSFSPDLRWLDGQLTEFTLFGTMLSSAKRQSLERNQGAAFGITVA